MVPRPLAPARAMRSRTCADVIQPSQSRHHSTWKSGPGRLQLVRSVTPVEVRFKDPETLTPEKEPPCEEHKPTEQIESSLSWLPEVYLSRLTAEQYLRVGNGY